MPQIFNAPLLCRLMEQRGISQTTLAERLGKIDARQVRRYQKGEVNTPYFDLSAGWHSKVVKMLVDIFDVPLSELLIECPPLPDPDQPYDETTYMHRGPDEDRAYNLLAAQHSAAVAIFGPRRYGQSWLVEHVLRRVSKARPEWAVVRIDVDGVPAEHMTKLASFLSAIERSIGSHLTVARLPPAGTDATVPPETRLKDFLEKVIEETKQHLILAIDSCERLMEHPYRAGFFSLLRHLACDRATFRDRLHILVAASTTRSRLSGQVIGSPFENLTPQLQPGELQTAQISLLARLHRLNWSGEDVLRVEATLGGHPRLLRMLMYRAATREESLDVLLGRNCLRDLFDREIREFRALIDRFPRLAATLRDGRKLSDEAYTALRQEAVIIRDPKREYRLRGLYKEFLR